MILIHAGGNEKIGVGNLSRCKTLSDALVENEVKNVVVVYEATKDVAEQFAPGNVDFCIAKDRIEALQLRNEMKNKYYDEKSILITDLYNLDEKDSEFARNQGFDYLVHLNDSGIPGYKADLMIDQEAFLKPWLVSDKIKFLHGAKYNIVKPEIVKVRESKPWNKNKVEKVLLCFGGSDPGCYIEKFMDYCNKANIASNIQFTVIVGPGVNSMRWDKIRKKALQNIMLERSPSNIGDFIIENDIIVTLGGITSYESMCIGRPVACIAWNNMKYYVEELDKCGLVKNLQSEYEAFDNLIELSQNINKLKELAYKGWNEVDGNGVYRIAEYITKKMLDKNY